MQIQKTQSPGPTRSVVPGSGLAPSQPQPQAQADSVQLGASAPQPPVNPKVQQALGMLQETAQVRQNLGQQFMGEVVAPLPAQFKEVLVQAGPHIDEIASQVASQGLPCDQFYLVASETKKLVQAGINAENRAHFRESQHQPADLKTMLAEELGYQAQAEILLNAFPDKAAEVAKQSAEGEALLTGGTFVNAMIRQLPADQAQQVQQIAAHSPVVLATQEHPELLQAAADALPTVAEKLVPAAQGTLGYFNVMGQVVVQEAQAGELLGQAKAEEEAKSQGAPQAQ